MRIFLSNTNNFSWAFQILKNMFKMKHSFSVFIFYSNGHYTARGAGWGISFDGFTSEIGTDGGTSSFGSTIDT